MTIRICPSILSADFTQLRSELDKIANADLVHVDVMDNHFVPNLTIGLPVVQQLAKHSALPLDVHLMIADPDTWAVEYAKAGAASVTFHAEAAQAPIRLARLLREAGSRCAIAVNPATPVTGLLPYLEEFDMVLIMSVEPGFGGQKFVQPVVDKVRTLREHINQHNLDTWIQLDGGVTRDNIGELAAAGADTFVAGSAVYNSADPTAEVAVLRERATAAFSPKN